MGEVSQGALSRLDPDGEEKKLNVPTIRITYGLSLLCDVTGGQSLISSDDLYRSKV